MLNFSGHRVRANYSAGGAGGEGGRTRLIPGYPLKRVRANLYSSDFFFVVVVVTKRVPAFPFVRQIFPLRRQRGTITRLRYVRLRGVTRVVFPFAHVSVFFPRSISNISDAKFSIGTASPPDKVTRNRDTCGADAPLACPRGKVRIIRNAAVIDCARLQYPRTIFGL